MKSAVVIFFSAFSLALLFLPQESLCDTFVHQNAKSLSASPTTLVKSINLTNFFMLNCFFICVFVIQEALLASRIDRLEANLENELALLKKQLMVEGNNPSNNVATAKSLRTASPVAFNRIPTSCSDLLASGHVSDGFYPVQNNTKIDMLYCNFTAMLIASNNTSNYRKTSIISMFGQINLFYLFFYVKRRNCG